MAGSWKEKIEIRALNTIEELVKVRNLEKMIWQDDDPIPVHQSSTVIKHGGLAIGAFIGSELIGFQFSFPGFDGSDIYLCSHNLGIHPKYRKLGIGEKIKLKQREKAIELGYQFIVWTYDPLETVNGYLNLSKLGGVCTQYIENCYGELPDKLNAGLPSDRFLVEWRMDEQHTISNQEQIFETNKQSFPLLVDIAVSKEGFPRPQHVNLNAGEGCTKLLVPVPQHFQEIKASNIDIAKEWRMATREIFKHYLEDGWVVTRLERGSHASVHYYVLSK